MPGSGGLDISVSVVGEAKLKKALKVLDSDPVYEEAMMLAAERLKLLIEGRTPVYRPLKGVAYQPGATKAAWTAPAKKGKKKVFIQNPLAHTEKLELGSYPKWMVVEKRKDGSEGRLAPATNPAGGSGIFSKQAPGGIAEPLLQDTHIRQSIAQLLAEQIDEALNRIIVGGSGYE